MNETPGSKDHRKLSPSEGTDLVADASTDNVLTASGEIDERRSQTELRFPSGQVLRVPTEFLLKQAGQVRPESPVPEGNRPPEERMMIPVIEEQMEVSKRTVVTGTVLLQKQMQEYDEQLDVPLAVRTFEVERVAVNRPVDVAPEVRQEGDTTIYSLVEEQLVLTKQLILKEEVRVTKRDTERRDTRTVTLKRESMTVTRKPAGEGGPVDG